VLGDPVGAVPTIGDLGSGVIAGCLKRIEERNAQHFDAEVLKLDHWSDDLKIGLERELKDIDQAIREAKASARQAASLDARVSAQRQIREFEGKRRQKRADIFTEQDRIDAQRDGIIDGLEKLMVLQHDVVPLYTVQWELA
jgi:adenine-specific DNA-methyltransferase